MVLGCGSGGPVLGFATSPKDSGHACKGLSDMSMRTLVRAAALLEPSAAVVPHSGTTRAPPPLASLRCASHAHRLGTVGCRMSGCPRMDIGDMCPPNAPAFDGIARPGGTTRLDRFPTSTRASSRRCTAVSSPASSSIRCPTCRHGPPPSPGLPRPTPAARPLSHPPGRHIGIARPPGNDRPIPRGCSAGRVRSDLVHEYLT